MRHNVDRIKHYHSKKKDSGYKIPDWAKTEHGAPPKPRQPKWAPPRQPWTHRAGPKPKVHWGGVAAGVAGLGAVGAYHHYKNKSKKAA